MKVAFVGKGGSGKSAVAGTFARALSRRGKPVLAIDSDPMPGLAWSLGIIPTDEGLPDEVTEEGGEGGPRFRLRADLTPTDIVEHHAQRGPDGVLFLQYGKLRGHVGTIARSQYAFSGITAELDDERWHLVGDLPAGTRQAYFGWARYADTLLVVVEPTVKSIMSGRRLARMADPTGRSERAHIPTVFGIANKVTSADDRAEIGRRTGLTMLADIPADDDFAAAERAGSAPIDVVSNGPAVRAIVSLVDHMETRERLRDNPQEESA